MKDVLSNKLIEADFDELVGQTIESIREVTPPLGFWGDSLDRICIFCKSGKMFYLVTDGGGNTFGFPGSQFHTVDLYKIKKPRCSTSCMVFFS